MIDARLNWHRGRTLDLLSPPAQTLDEGEVPRNYEHPKTRCDQHAEEDPGAHHILDAGTLLLDRDALLIYFRGQASSRSSAPILREHVGGVLVGPDFEVNVQQHAAVAGIRRL